MYCTHCGKQMPDDARFCPACGKAALETKPAVTEEASPKPVPTVRGKPNKDKKEKKKSLGERKISVKTLLIVAGVAFLIYFIYASDLYFLIFEFFPEEPYTETYAEPDPPETEPVPETDPPEPETVETAPPETKAPETKPPETKPKETKPKETKPKETKPKETTAPETTAKSGIPPLHDKSIPDEAIGGPDNPDPVAYVNKAITGAVTVKPSQLPDVKTRIQALLAEDNYSRQVIVVKMQNEGYGESEVTSTLDSMGIDWKAIALARINKIHFPGAASWTEYRKQLKGHKFTDEETEYVIEQFDWKAIAVDRAGWIRISAWSYEEAYDQMIAEGFTPEEATYGLAQHFD